MVPNTYSDHNFLSSHTVYKIDIIEMNKSISSCVDNEVYVLCTYKCMYVCMYVCVCLYNALMNMKHLIPCSWNFCAHDD